MQIAASTDGNSTFVMPLSSKSNISSADFVVFEQPEKVDTLDDVALRKLSFERRRRTEIEAGSRMKIDMALDVRPDVEVELEVAGNTVKGRGAGALNLQINPRDNIFMINGDYTIAEGSFMLSLQQIINKRFTIESGSSIQWTGFADECPAGHRRRVQGQGVAAAAAAGTSATSGRRPFGSRSSVSSTLGSGFRIPASGSMSGFRVRTPRRRAWWPVRSRPLETVDTQFLYLLLFNSFMSESTTQDTSNIGSSVSAATGLEFVSNMVSNWLSSSDYNVVIRYRPKSELTSDEVGFRALEEFDQQPAVRRGRGQLPDRQQAGREQQLDVQLHGRGLHHLPDRPGRDAQTERPSRRPSTVLTRTRVCRETGIGVYFKEDFDNLRDLRQPHQGPFHEQEAQGAASGAAPRPGRPRRRRPRPGS